MNKQCLDCAMKHLARAEIQAEEYEMGNPKEGRRVVGDLSLAESHLYIRWPEIAYEVRRRRLEWADYLNGGPRATLVVDDIIEDLGELYKGETDGGADDTDGDGAGAVRRGPDTELEGDLEGGYAGASYGGVRRL